jgi:hypothetical protein
MRLAQIWEVPTKDSSSSSSVTNLDFVLAQAAKLLEMLSTSLRRNLGVITRYINFRSIKRNSNAPNMRNVLLLSCL